MSARSGFTRSHNALVNKISSDCTSWYTDDPMHSVFAESKNLSQVKDSNNQIHTIQFYIAERYLVFNTFVESVRYLITLLRYTLPYYYVNTLLR